MARIDTLSNFLTDVADSIREKTGNTEPISCEDFDTEIESISGGGTEISDCSSFFKSGVRVSQFEDLFPLVKKPQIAFEMFMNIPYASKPNNFNTLVNTMDTSGTTSMSYMFAGAISTGGLSLSFNTSNVTDMSYMFADNNTTTASTYNLSSFNTSNVTNMTSMFSSNYGLRNLDLSSFTTSNEKTVNMADMFHNSLYITNIKVGNIRPNTLNQTFSGAGNRSTEIVLELSNMDTSSCTSLYQTFHSAKIKTLDLSNFNTSNVTTMQGTFDGANSLTNVTISSSFVTNNVTTMLLMFRDCYSLENFDFSNFNTAKVTSMVQMFSNCRVITKLNLSTFTSEKVTQTANMFQNCYKLEEIDLSNFDFTTKITSFGSMFANCGTQTNDGLTKVYVKDTDAQNWILTKSNGKPSTWSTANVIVAGSSDDLRGSE